MTKVITYGTYDLLHYGHIKLLERAKSLGDYLIVGVTSDDFDKGRGKINVTESLSDRVSALRATGLADEIIIEEYAGQKIDDIRKYNIDIFTVGSDWVGKFDYLNEYCKVVYLDRTEGVSSSEIRGESKKIRLGFLGASKIIKKFITEASFVNGIEISGIFSTELDFMNKVLDKTEAIYNSYNALLENSDAIFIISEPKNHYKDIFEALNKGKHVLCESPITISKSEFTQLEKLAKAKKCILMDSIKTAYSLAYHRLLLLIKTGTIGDVVSVDATCTSLVKNSSKKHEFDSWNSIESWGPTAMLPIFQILGTDYKSKSIISRHINKDTLYDVFTKVDFVYGNAVASLKVGNGVKSEGQLVISGTNGCLYVPAPWWKTDYFEIHYEDITKNKRFFYQLEGEGIRYELVAFVSAIETRLPSFHIENNVSHKITEVIEDYYKGTDTTLI